MEMKAKIGDILGTKKNRKHVGTTMNIKLWKNLQMLALQMDQDTNDLLEVAVLNFLDDHEEEIKRMNTDLLEKLLA
jgi:hypothetical protein